MMGKSKRKTKLSSLRTKNWPIISNSDNSLEAELIGDNLLAEIKSKLVSGKPSERHLAADMISSSISDFDSYTDKELSELIRILSPICVDRVENCRNAAIDSLCYLSSKSDKLCDLMVSADVMTPLNQLFTKFFGTVGFKWTESQKSQLISQIYINSCRLLTNLCGTSDKAMKIFNNSDITQILINGLKAFDINIEVSIASAQCLSVVAEENQISGLLLPENIDLIRNYIQKPIENSSELHLSNLMAFIVINVSLTDVNSTYGTVFKLIDQTLTVQCLQQIKDFADLLQQFIDNEKSIDLLKKNFIELKNLLLAKSVALELITNIIGTPDDDNDVEDMDCDEDLDDSDDNEDIDRQNSGLNEDRQQKLSPELEKLLLDHSIGDKVGQHLGSVDDVLKQILVKNAMGMEILNSIENIQLCSLTCVHNLAENCVSTDVLVITEQLWTQILSLVLTASTINTQLMSESTNTIRALINNKPGLYLTTDQLELLCNRCQSIESLTVKINVINLMSILAQRSTDLDFIEKITQLLMSGLQTETDLVIRAEIFDALIDIHSEDYKTDSVSIKLDLINRLKQFAAVFKNEAKKSRELKTNPIVSTVLLNLMPFIKYKQKVLNKK